MYRTNVAPVEAFLGYELIVARGGGVSNPWITRAFRWKWLAYIMMYLWIVTHPSGFARLRKGDELPTWDRES